MHDARGVGDDEHGGDLLRDDDGLRPRLLVDPVGQAAALDELHDEPVGVVARDVVVGAADVRVIELREDAGLAEEPFLRFGVQAAVGLDRLERHTPLQGLVKADVDVTHAAGAEAAENPVARNPAGERGLFVRQACGANPTSGRRGSL